MQNRDIAIRDAAEMIRRYLSQTDMRDLSGATVESLEALKRVILEKTSTQSGSVVDSAVLGQRATELARILQDVEQANLSFGRSGAAESLIVLQKRLDERLSAFGLSKRNQDGDKGSKGRTDNVAAAASVDSSNMSTIELVREIIKILSNIKKGSVTIGDHGLGEYLLQLREMINDKVKGISGGRGSTATSSSAVVEDTYSARAKELVGMLQNVEDDSLTFGLATGRIESLVVLKERLEVIVSRYYPNGKPSSSKAGPLTSFSASTASPHLMDNLHDLMALLGNMDPKSFRLGSSGGLAESLVVLRHQLNDKLQFVSAA